MAYNAVAQIDHEVASNSSASASRSPSPAHGHAFEQLPLDTDHLGGGTHLQLAHTTDNSSFGQLGSMIRSMTSRSYDVVEDDDYDADPSHEQRANSHPIPPLNTAIERHSSPEPPLHSACSDVPVPLSHPTPDLQSIQGAYKGNVTRLEESAEQLSLCSADIESEIRRIDQEQKRRSVSSVSNSIIAVTRSSTHGSNVSPARQRSASGPRLPQVSEPAHDERAHEVDDEFAGLANLPPSQPLFDTQAGYYYDQYVPQGASADMELERRASVASNDTYQQARTLFTDFDGVHFAPLERLEPGRQVSLDQPPLARKPEHYKQPQAGENMVFYPAPVPRMLNLPPKLSRRTATDRDKRRSQLAGAIAAEDRKSALLDADRANPHNDKRISAVPPHLRASVFFDQPSTTLPLEVKQDSAVATLDSILDASANAPVSAFTDHPYAGHVGSYIYNKSKHKTLTKDPSAQKTNRLSRVTMGDSYGTNHADEHGGPTTSRQEIDGSDYSDRVQAEHIRGRDDDSSKGTDSESDDPSEEEEDEEDGEMDYVGPPNTLIAELELRKNELKHRRRTAVPMPFQGMQSTLLEMDEMAQKQSDKRRQRPVALAWEGRDEDEDVPLAMLYPDKISADDEDRPLGLIEKRQQEENEPLSSRRARLRGEPVPKPTPRPATVYAMEPPAHIPKPAADSGDETEIETLAQRLARLKGHNRSESQFAAELMAEIDSRVGIAPENTHEVPEPNEEETLAQRRSRLQKEAAAQSGTSKNPRVRRSMAALTQGRPSQISRQSSHDVFSQRPVTMSQYGNRMSMQQFPAQTGYAMPTGYPMAQQYGYPVGYPPNYVNNPAMAAMNGLKYAPNTAQHSSPLSTDVIDRWRQSIR